MKRKLMLAGAMACLIVWNGSAETLRWNGTSSQLWDDETVAWLTEASAATAWLTGSRALFGLAEDATVWMKDEKTVSGVTFAGDGCATVDVGAASTAPSYTGEWSDYRTFGLAVLETDGVAGTIDATAGAGAVNVGLTDLEYDTATGCTSGSRAEGVTTATVLSDNTEIVYWKDRTLSEIKNVRAIFIKNSAETVARTHYFSNDGTTATAQFVKRERGTGDRVGMMCVLVTFTQDGDDIKVKQTASKYVYNIERAAGGSNNGDEAFDFSSSGIWIGTGNYQIRDIRAGEEKDAGGQGIELLAAGDATPSSSTDALPTTDTLLWRNSKLADIEALYGMVWEQPGKAYFLTWNSDKTELTAKFQSYRQWGTLGAYIMSIQVLFTQKGDDIYGRMIGRGYRTVEGGRYRIPYDGGTFYNDYKLYRITPVFKSNLAANGMIDSSTALKISGTVTIGSPARISAAAISGVGSVRYRRETPANEYHSVKVLASVTNTYAGATIFDGGRHVLYSPFAVPAYSAIVLTNNAHVTLNHSDVISGRATVVDIGPGCTLANVAGKQGLSNDTRLNVNGGRLEMNEQGFYIGPLTLENGASVGGNASFRLCKEANSPDIVFSVGDTSKTNEIACGIRIYKKPAAANDTCFASFAVEAPLVLSGSLNPPEKPYSTGYIRKIGSGPLILAPTASNMTDPTWSMTARVDVVEGTLRNESIKKALNEKNYLSLQPGTTFEVAAGVEMKIGDLRVENTTGTDGVSTVKFEAGSSLSLPDGGLAVAENSTLVLTGEFGANSLFVGETVSAAVLSRVRHLRDGHLYRVKQDETGYLEPYTPGFSLIVK